MQWYTWANGERGAVGYWLTVVVRILIADAHEVVRAGLVRIVESRSSWEVVAVAGDGKEAVQKAIETKPDIAVIGYALPLINGIEVTRQIRARLPKTEVLIFIVHDDEAVITQLLHAGARGYLLKSDARKNRPSLTAPSDQIRACRLSPLFWRRSEDAPPTPSTALSSSCQAYI
jgi:CheY-like chemotaxis protein